MTTNQELEDLGLDDWDRYGYWDKLGQDSVTLRVHLDRKDLKDKYQATMGDINTFLAISNPTQAQYNAAVRKIVEVVKLVLIFHKIELGL